ncbi:MAG: response regulator [Candidatus Margulisiibacteriota bacterium]
MGKKILLIEDYKDTAEMIANVLRQKGHDVSCAYDGDAGLRRARERGADLILLDIMLPGMDGFTVLQELKKDPVTAGIPVIIVTVKVAEEDVERGLALGASEYVCKPFDLEKLAGIVQKHL